MSTATLNGLQVTAARVNIPQWGPAWAEVSVDGEHDLVGQRVSLVVADLTLSMTVVSGGPGKGRSSFRAVAGAGGWARTVARKSYLDDAGAKVATVVQDAAQAATETLAGDLPTTRVGPGFWRPEGPASDVLEQVSPRAWYVDEAGATRLGRRPTTPVTIEAPRDPIDLDRGILRLAAEQISALVPGCVVDGIEAADVEHEVGAGVRTTLRAGHATGLGRLDGALREKICRLFPVLRLPSAPWEYRVVTQDGERLNLQPVLSSLGLPDMRGVFVRCGVPGARADVELGSRVLVALVNGDRSRPVVLAFEDADSDGFVPTRLDLVADRIDLAPGAGEAGLTGAQVLAQRRYIRYGDPLLGLVPGVVGLASPTMLPSDTATPPVSVVRGGP